LGVRFAADAVGWYNPVMAQDTGSGRPLLDKLGVRFGAAVALVDWADDAGFEELLATRTDDVTAFARDSARPAGSGYDLLFFRARGHADLAAIVGFRPLVKTAGAIWVVREKGPARVISDTDVIDAGLAAGLVDNKIASFSDTLAAMRLVTRLRDR
jgi:hypothetical protein